LTRKNGYPQRAQQGNQFVGAPNRAIRYPFNQNAHDGGNQHCYQQGGNKGQMKFGHQHQTHKGANHQYVPVSKIDYFQDAVDHGISKGNQGVEATHSETVYKLLKEHVHQVVSLLWACRRTGTQAPPGQHGYYF